MPGTHHYTSRKRGPNGRWIYTYAPSPAPAKAKHAVDIDGLLRGNFGIPRIDMPQISSKLVPEFIEELRAQGTSVTRPKVAVSSLKATQGELHADKVLGLAKPENLEHLRKPVIVSSDGFLLDGHHRWAALRTMDPTAQIQAVKVGLPIRQLLDAAKNFSKVGFKKAFIMNPQQDFDRAFNMLLKSDLDLTLDWLCKGAGHKYLRRVPTGKLKPKFRYIYSVNSKYHGNATPKVGEKVRVDHDGEEGHYEVTEKHDDGHVTVKHDETGHEMKIHRTKLQEAFKDQHADKIDDVAKKLLEVYKKAAQYGTDKQQDRALAELRAHAARYKLGDLNKKADAAVIAAGADKKEEIQKEREARKRASRDVDEQAKTPAALRAEEPAFQHERNRKDLAIRRRQAKGEAEYATRTATYSEGRLATGTDPDRFRQVARHHDLAQEAWLEAAALSGKAGAATAREKAAKHDMAAQRVRDLKNKPKTQPGKLPAAKVRLLVEAMQEGLSGSAVQKAEYAQRNIRRMLHEDDKQRHNTLAMLSASNILFARATLVLESGPKGLTGARSELASMFAAELDRRHELPPRDAAIEMTHRVATAKESMAAGKARDKAKAADQPAKNVAPLIPTPPPRQTIKQQEADREAFDAPKGNYHQASDGTHHVDTKLVQDTEGMPDAELVHQGFGSFILKFRGGDEVRFSKAMGKDFPGQQGNSFKMTGPDSKIRLVLETTKNWDRAVETHEAKGAYASAAKAADKAASYSGAMGPDSPAAKKAAAAHREAAKSGASPEMSAAHEAAAEAYDAYANYATLNEKADGASDFPNNATPEHYEKAAAASKKAEAAADDLADAIDHAENASSDAGDDEKMTSFLPTRAKVWADAHEQDAAAHKDRAEKPKRSNDAEDEDNKPVGNLRKHEDPKLATAAADAASAQGTLNWNEVHALHENAKDVHEKLSAGEGKAGNRYKMRAHDAQAAHHEAAMGNWGERYGGHGGRGRGLGADAVESLPPKFPHEAKGRSEMVDANKDLDLDELGAGDTITDHEGDTYRKESIGWTRILPDGKESDTKELFPDLTAEGGKVRVSRVPADVRQASLFGSGSSVPGGKEKPSVKKEPTKRPAKKEGGKWEGPASASNDAFNKHKQASAKNPDGYAAAEVGTKGHPYKSGDTLSFRHNSAENAYVVDDYPYGRSRTQKRYWMETTKSGQRLVTQTKHPYQDHWNKPKKSTYSDHAVMKFDEKGHIGQVAVRGAVGEPEKQKAFLKEHGAAMDPARRVSLEKQSGMSSSDQFKDHIGNLVAKAKAKAPKKPRGAPKTRGLLEAAVAKKVNKFDQKTIGAGKNRTIRLDRVPVSEARRAQLAKTSQDTKWSRGPGSIAGTTRGHVKLSQLTDAEITEWADSLKVEHDFGKSAGYTAQNGERKMMNPQDRAALLKAFIPQGVDAIMDASTAVLSKGAGEGSRGGKIIGHTGSGKPIYAGGGKSKKYSAHDHDDAAVAHRRTGAEHSDAADSGRKTSPYTTGGVGDVGEHGEASAHHYDQAGKHATAAAKGGVGTGGAPFPEGHKNHNPDLGARKGSLKMAKSNQNSGDNLSKGCAEGSCGADAMGGKTKKKKKKNKAPKAKTVNLNPMSAQGGLTKSFDEQAAAYQGDGWYDGKPKLQPILQAEYMLPDAAPTAHAAATLTKSQAEQYAWGAVDIALREIFRAQVMLNEASNPAVNALLSKALGTERPSIVPGMEGLIQTEDPNLIDIAKAASSRLRAQANRDHELAKGLAAIEATEELVGARLYQLDLTPEKALLGQ